MIGKRSLVCLLLAVSVAGCKKQLAETNLNPNSPQIVNPEYLLNTSILSTMNLFGGAMRREVFSHYSNYVSVGGGQFPRYGVFPSTNTSYWQAAFIGCLQPVNQIQLNFGGKSNYNNRVAIARILKCYVYSNIVAIWGGVPYTNSLKGSDTVRYDKEEDVYYSVVDELKSAASAINLEGDTYPPSADALYGGNLAKWQKFANTLRLRIAMRISNAAPNGNPARAQQVVADVLADETKTIAAADETAHSFWGTTSATWSFFYDYNVYKLATNLVNLNVVSESLVQHMLPYNDPRLKVYAKPASQGPMTGKYWGQPKSSFLPKGVSLPNNPNTNRANADYSQVGDYFAKPDAEFVFLSFEESCFLKAEAALKGWGGAETPETYYRRGVTASMTKYGLPEAEQSAYLATPGVAWNTAVDTAGRGAEFEDFLHITTSAILEKDPFHQIVLQTWIAGFYNAIDAWTLIRRSQVLEFPPHFNPDGTSATEGLGYAYIPQRVVYPDIEYQVNTTEVNKAASVLSAGDKLDTKLWFALPTLKNKYLPQ